MFRVVTNEILYNHESKFADIGHSLLYRGG